MGDGVAVAVGEGVNVRVALGGRVGWGVPVGRSGAGLVEQATSSIANIVANNSFFTITIFII